MLGLFSKCRLALLSALLLNTMSCSLNAWENYNSSDCCYSDDCNRLYIGAFGGGIRSNSPRTHQLGTAFFSELTSIGPLSVIGEGRLNKISTGFGGVQLGYEWSKPLCSGWSIAPAGELEAFFFRHKTQGHLVNQTVNGLDEHDFVNSFNVHSGVILANIVLALNSDCLCGFSPYIGGGIGATRISLHNGDSSQVVPVESGINHFNSRTHDSDWTFAAQAKAGLRYNFCQMFHIFAEYRYLYVDASNYVFGSTNYTTHVPTSPWNVKINSIHYNAVAVGIQFDL